MNNKLLVTVLCLILSASLLGGCRGGGSGSGDTGSTRCEDATGFTLVGLGSQGNGIYNNADSPTQDPRVGCPTEHAVITKATNDSGHNISLAHGGPGSAFTVLNSGDSTTAFNGQFVEGNWSAQRSGNVAGEPSGITVKVEWKKP